MNINAQAVFNTVATHLLTQNKKSFIKREANGVDLCLYRGPDGLKCAIGVLIKDELYREEIEGASPSIEVSSIPKVRMLYDILSKSIGVALDDADIAFLRSLQLIHDSKPVEGWLGCLESLAKESNLTMPT